MPDDDGFDKAFQEGLNIEESTTPPADPPQEDPATPPAGGDDPAPTDPKNTEEPTVDNKLA